MLRHSGLDKSYHDRMGRYITITRYPTNTTRLLSYYITSIRKIRCHIVNTRYSLSAFFCQYLKLMLRVAFIFWWWKSKSSYSRLEIRQVICRSRHLSPTNSPITVNSKSAACLPTRTALGWSIPYTLILAETEDIPQGKGVDGMPCGRDTETPVSIKVAFFVNHNVDIPSTANLGQPFVGSLL